MLTGLAVASKKLLSCATKTKKKRKPKSQGSKESTLMVHPHGLMAGVMGLRTSQSRIMGLQASALVRKIPAAENSALHWLSASAAHVPPSAKATQRSSIVRGAKASWIRQYEHDRQSGSSKKGKTKHQE